MFLRRKVETDPNCLVCGRRPGIISIEGGKACPYCAPVGPMYDLPTVEEVRAQHVKDPELIERVNRFTETETMADFRFDDTHSLFMKGPWPSYCLPVLSYTEVKGFTLRIDDRPVAFNSIDGSRSIIRPMTDEALKKATRETGTMVLEVESSRSNVSVKPYDVLKNAEGSKEERFRAAIALSRKFDSIVEANILAKR